MNLFIKSAYSGYWKDYLVGFTGEYYSGNDDHYSNPKEISYNDVNASRSIMRIGTDSIKVDIRAYGDNSQFDFVRSGPVKAEEISTESITPVSQEQLTAAEEALSGTTVYAIVLGFLFLPSTWSGNHTSK